MTNEELGTKPTELQIAKAMDGCGIIGNDMIRRLAWQVDVQESLIRRAIVGLKHCGDFSRTNGSDPHPLDCSLAGRVAHVFGMGMTRACMLVRRHGEDPAFMNDLIGEEDDTERDSRDDDE
jgi:hypothetical protein